MTLSLRRAASNRLAVGHALLAALLLAGCGGESYLGSRALAVQGKHSWQTCQQLSVLREAQTKKINDLRLVMDKGARDAGGGLVNITVHQPTLVGLEAERRLVEDTMAGKNCGAPAAAPLH